MFLFDTHGSLWFLVGGITFHSWRLVSSRWSIGGGLCSTVDCSTLLLSRRTRASKVLISYVKSRSRNG